MSDPVMFSGADYAVFAALLFISVAIGIYYAWKDRNEKDANAYLVGNGEMSPIPVAISLCVSYVSGVMTVGVPTQVYYYGVIMIWYTFGYFVGPLVTSIYFIPTFFRLKITSVYEILDMRFGKWSRICASSSVIVLMVVYMGIVTYIPCLSLSAVSSMSVPLTIFITCSVCTFYTTLGGIKAVIWTDVVQAVVMMVGMITVLVSGANQVGGLSKAAEALARGSRNNFFVMSFDPRIRHTTWSLVLGAPVVGVMMAAFNQPMVQRYLSCKSVRHARIAVWTYLLPMECFFVTSVLAGVILYAYFETCDPLFSKSIHTPDQALPFMVVKLFQDLPGLAGVFVAAVYSGTLSTVSSGINALSAVVLSDFILVRKPSLKSKSLAISKFLVFILGAVVLGVTFLVRAMGKLVVDLFIAAFGCIGGPLSGVYTMALFMPWTNEKGAVSGQILGTAFSFWMAIGQIIYPPPLKYLQIKPLSIDGCSTTHIDFVNTTDYMALNHTDAEYMFSGDLATTAASFEAPPAVYDERPAIADTLYAVSTNYMGLCGFLVCLLVGVIVSGFTGFEDPKYANPDIFIPIVNNKILPLSVIKFFRFGVPVRQRVNSWDKSSFDESMWEDGKESRV